MVKLERVGPTDPNACQGTLGTGRCHYKAMPGARYCGIHGGGATQAANERKELRNYRLETIHGQRASELANSSGLKDLTDEIALTRYMIEKLFKNIQNDNDFLIYHDKINSLVGTVNKLIENLQKIQERNKELIDRQTLMAMTDGILGVILKYIEDPDTQKVMADQIYDCVIKCMGE